jgi:hypothetical protein
MERGSYGLLRAKYARACATIRAQSITIRHLQADLTRSRKKSADVKAMISNSERRLQDLIELNDAFGTESSLSLDFIRGLINNLRIDCPEHRRYSAHTISVVYSLYYCSGKAYRFLKQLLPLPAVSQLHMIFQSTVLLHEQHLTSLDSLHHLVGECRFRDELSSDSQIDIILEVDAATLQPDANSPLVELEVCKNGQLFFFNPA